MEVKFIPVDYDYFDFNGRNYVRLIGRNDKGKRICIIDDYEPNFWAILNDSAAKSKKKIDELIKKIEKIKVDNGGRKSVVEKVEIHNKKFLGKDVKALRVFVTNHKDAYLIADKIKDLNLGVEHNREKDISLITKYIKEKNIEPLIWYSLEGDLISGGEFGGIENLDVDFCLKAKSMKKLEKQEVFSPKILAYDIETDGLELGRGDILMISLYGKNFKKVLTWKHCSKKQDFVECFKDEGEMLETFVKYVKEYSPDILVGYFSDGFDLPYLRARAGENKIKLSLGLDDSQPVFARGRIPQGKINGIVHVDLFRFIETAYAQYLKSETLSLNEVAGELLGEKKHDFDMGNLTHMKEGDWKDFFAYNLKDSELAWKLVEKLWPDMFELSKFVKEPLFNLTRYGLSGLVENYVIHNIDKFNEIVEKRPIHEEIGRRRSRGKFEGAFVLQPTPGLYEDIGMFDFTSMHTSIISSFNISKTTLLDKKEKGAYESPEIEFKEGKKKIYFSSEKGFFPILLDEIFRLRKKFKKEWQDNPNPITRARSNVFKLLSASVHGYQAFFGARYYSFEAAAAVLAYVRKFNKEIIDKVNEEDYKVIYADSVGAETKVIVRKGEMIYETEIKNLFEKTDRKSLLGKEYNFLKDIEVLTLDDNGKSIFRPAIYIMKHQCDKKMYRVNFTNNWSIDVTEDHSLMGYQALNFNQSNINKENPLKRIIEIKPAEIGKKVKSIVSLKKIPLNNPVSEDYPTEVYEFMGFFIGDGSFVRNKTYQKYNKDYYLRLSLGSDSVEIFEKLIKPLIKKNYIKNYWWSKSRKGDITINGLKLVKLISENFGSENNKKSIPGWLFKEKEENIGAFLRGLFSADGCVMIRNNAPIIKYTSINDKFIENARKLLYRMGISHSVFKENSVNRYKTKDKTYSAGSYSKNIILKNKDGFVKKVGFLQQRKNKRAEIKTDALKTKAIKNFEFDLQGVKSVEKIKTPEYVYDIEVEDNHRFFANYVLVHNTDSIAFLRGKKSKKDVKEFLKKLNLDLPGIMELDLEDFYKRGLFVSKRTTDAGAKKKYALIDEDGKMKIRGFETVRRDWCKLARNLQNKVLEKVLKEGNEKSALKILKDVVENVKARKVESDDLIIRTQLKKPINEYLSEGPHVVAAKKMEARDIPVSVGMLVEYFIGETSGNKKSKTVGSRVFLPDEKAEYDVEYYLNNQVLPAVENIFEVFGVDLRGVVEGETQKKLFS